jgi:hypothetical protein
MEIHVAATRVILRAAIVAAPDNFTQLCLTASQTFQVLWTPAARVPTFSHCAAKPAPSGICHRAACLMLNSSAG